MSQTMTARRRPLSTRAPRSTCVVMVAMIAVLTMARAGILAAGQPAVSPESGSIVGTITLSRSARADGQLLAPGTYELRLTTRQPAAIAAGPPSEVNRWVEFVQNGGVQGQEIAIVIPEAEIGSVAKTRPPAAGTARVDALKDSEFVRIWVSHEGLHYLIHLTG